MLIHVVQADITVVLETLLVLTTQQYEDTRNSSRCNSVISASIDDKQRKDDTSLALAKDMLQDVIVAIDTLANSATSFCNNRGDVVISLATAVHNETNYLADDDTCIAKDWPHDVLTSLITACDKNNFSQTVWPQTVMVNGTCSKLVTRQTVHILVQSLLVNDAKNTNVSVGKDVCIVIGAVVALMKLARTPCICTVLDEILSNGGQALQQLIYNLDSDETLLQDNSLQLLLQLCCTADARLAIRSHEGAIMVSNRLQLAGPQAVDTLAFISLMRFAVALARTDDGSTNSSTFDDHSSNSSSISSDTNSSMTPEAEQLLLLPLYSELCDAISSVTNCTERAAVTTTTTTTQTGFVHTLCNDAVIPALVMLLTRPDR
jgi:hypothetical protein